MDIGGGCQRGLEHLASLLCIFGGLVLILFSLFSISGSVRLGSVRIRMAGLAEIVCLLSMAAMSTAAASATGTMVSAAEATTSPAPSTLACSSGNGYDGRVGVRVSAIFVILLGSYLGK